ncbi:josephin-2-like isoform X1 [Scyliorhinus torazame]|uniref:josephin-2-like isoform X1 n=1 Tax=Scyliorhinus torazame TaxID=75743 RepID=UPI003B59077F
MSEPPRVWGCRSPPPPLYHERQRLELCALHALNNLLQQPLFTQQQLDGLSGQLAPDSLVNPHRSLLGTGNYDVNVLMAALLTQGLAAIWWDKRKSLSSLVLSRVHGFILNIPSNMTLGFVSLPIQRKHWVAVRLINGAYYNLHSKLKAPVPIGNEEELRKFLQDQIAQDPCELLLVVPREVEEDGSWLLAP